MGAAALPAAIGLTAAGGVESAVSQEMAGKSQSVYYNYLAKSAAINAGLAGAEATSAKRNIGVQEGAEQVRLTNRVNQTIGAQKASMVGGVGASSRSAQDIIGDTINKGDLDELNLRMNAELASKNADVTGMSSAMNYNAQAGGYNVAGAVARSGANMGAASSLLGSAGSVANSWFMGNMYAGRGGGGIGSLGPSSGGWGGVPYAG